MKKRAVILLIISVLLVILVCLFIFNSSPKTAKEKGAVLFSKYEAWGPCPPSQVCWQNTTLYYSGELILNGNENNETILDKATLDNIKSKIESTEIMNKNCSAEMVMDYGASYRINYAGQTKKINFPGCRAELSEIEAFFK